MFRFSLSLPVIALGTQTGQRGIGVGERGTKTASKQEVKITSHILLPQAEQSVET